MGSGCRHYRDLGYIWDISPKDLNDTLFNTSDCLRYVERSRLPTKNGAGGSLKSTFNYSQLWEEYMIIVR